MGFHHSFGGWASRALVPSPAMKVRRRVNHHKIVIALLLSSVLVQTVTASVVFLRGGSLSVGSSVWWLATAAVLIFNLRRYPFSPPGPRQREPGS